MQAQFNRMNLLRNILGLVLGLLIGGAINMGIITVGGQFVPPPPGVDVSDMDSLRESMHLFAPRHFLVPFAAHALGTLTGALVAVLIGASYRMALAFTVGLFFLLGGIAAAFMLPAPTWFILADLALAYIPMAWLGGRLGTRLRPG